jgi:dihydrofolate reductase
MAKVFCDITMSLDGFITGPNDCVEFPLGEGGERLHQWVYDLASWRERHGMEGGITNADAEILDEAVRDIGAIVMGCRMFNLGEGPWGDPPPFHVPVFVVTHGAREPLVKAGAPPSPGDRDVSVAGGANVIQQFLDAGLLDELQIHVAPVLLGRGRRLFDQPREEPIELESTRVVGSPDVTHLRFRVVK